MAIKLYLLDNTVMDLKHLSYFISVYEQQSFSAAAKHCFIAQPSISNAIALLEEELSQKLFIRHARGITPTQQGEKLYPLAKQLLGQAEAIKTTFNTHQKKQTFKLGVTKGLGVKRMSNLLKEFTAAEPSMELTLVPQDEKCDARIITKEELANHENYLSIWQENYLLALPLNHSLSLQKEIKLSDLDGLGFIQRSPCIAWKELTKTLSNVNIELDIRAKVQTIDYALGLVRAAVGCALVPAFPEVIENKDLNFSSINELQLNREIILAYHTESPLIDTLKQTIINTSKS